MGLAPADRWPTTMTELSLRCPSCDHANPDGSKFCNACGMRVDFRDCPLCDAVNQAAAIRCYKCGTSLTPGNARGAVRGRRKRGGGNARARVTALGRDAPANRPGTCPAPHARCQGRGRRRRAGGARHSRVHRVPRPRTMAAIAQHGRVGRDATGGRRYGRCRSTARRGQCKRNAAAGDDRALRASLPPRRACRRLRQRSRARVNRRRNRVLPEPSKAASRERPQAPSRRRDEPPHQARSLRTLRPRSKSHATRDPLAPQASS